MSHNKQVTDSDINNSRAGQSTQAQASSTSGGTNHPDAPRVLSDEASAQQPEESKLDNTALSEKQKKSNITNGQKSDTNSPKQLPPSQPPEQSNRDIQQSALSTPFIANQYMDMGTRRDQNGRRSPIVQPHNQQPTNILTDNAPENSLICQETCQPADDSEPDQDQNQDITAIEHLQVRVPATSLEEPDLPLCYQFISLENRGLPRFSYLVVIYSAQNLPQPNLM